MKPTNPCHADQGHVPPEGVLLKGFPEVVPPRDAANLSPSLLWPTKTSASYEVKFLLRPAQAEEVRAWARQHLAVDPHADVSLGDAYRIRSVYFDTDQLDVFHQTRSFKRRKFRLRRYGAERGIYLERKVKAGDRVTKRRTLLADQELGRLQDAAPDSTWPAYWFHKRLLARQLKPRCLISYERIAHVGMSAEGPIRLTLDRNIQCTPTDDYDFEFARPGIPLLAEEIILELKYRAAMPALFKSLLHAHGLHPCRASKYRLGIQAWGLATNAKEVG